MKNEVIEQVIKFRDERNWSQFHNGKDLAISLSLEAAELLEVYQWSATDLEVGEKLDKIKEELADIFMYGLLIADKYSLDLDQIILDKIKRNNEKYPVELAYNHKEKYDELKKNSRSKQD